mmetsp:Transcript_55675/g.162801  ORF Transcript_55675/g.162801 Transcript_55675/m.162801 type:complete len:345 (+) Transcript_55675:114-1148(+)
MEVLAQALEEVLEWLPISGLVPLLRSAPKLRLLVDSPVSWQRRCVALWRDKVYVSPQSRDLLAQGRAMQAVQRSIEDLRRNSITAEELCSMVWSCRMKGSAGKSWTSNDPWWNGWAAQRRRFTDSGEVLKPGSAEGAWEPCVIDGEATRWYFPSWVPEWAEEDSTPGRSHRPVARPIPEGSRIKIDDYPTHLVWRHPMNWGFVLDSPWSVMTSFELPSRAAIKHGSPGMRELARTLTDASLRNNVNISVLECDFFRSGVHVPREPPAPEHFFAQEDGEGGLEFFIRREHQELAPSDGELEEDAEDGEEAEAEEAEHGGESEEAEVDSEDEESSIEQDVEDDPAV